MAPDSARAFAPGRVNVVGEHTDYNGGLSLAFAIAEGVTVVASRRRGRGVTAGAPLVSAIAAQLRGAGCDIPAAEVEISSSLPAGEGLSSSAALAVAAALALLALAGEEPGDPFELAGLCRRAEGEATGTRSGLLDQLASLCGRPGHALRIDFSARTVEAVPLELGRWQLGVAPSGETRELSASPYNERRAECEQACALLGLESLRRARPGDAEGLPDPLGRRLRHVLEENARVDAAVTALKEGDRHGLARVLDASHASLRDLYAASTEAVERTVARLRRDGAVGARMMGGGFGGSVLGLFAPGLELPVGVRAVAPGPGARVLGRR